MIHLTTLGELRCTFNGASTDIPRQRVRCALLILLATERRVSRSRACALLWPASDAKAARHVLSQTLYELRRSFGDDWLELNGDTICATHRLTIDTQSFENVERAGADRLAMQFYRGPFLDRFALRSEPFNAWIAARRRTLDGLHREVAARLERQQQARRNGRTALTSAWRSARSSAGPRDQASRPRLRAATAAAIGFITLVLHAATPGLMPAAINVPDHARYAIFAFDSDVPSEPDLDERNRVMRALARAGLTGAVATTMDGRTGDLASLQRAARAMAAGRIITGRIERIGVSTVVTASATESYGAGRELGRATVVLHPGANADSAFFVLMELLRVATAR